MVFKKKNPHYRSKPKFTKYRKNKFTRRGPTTTVIKSPSVLLDRLQVKLKYATTNTSSSTVIPPAHLIRTSIFDPDVTAGGHQPLGRDEWNYFFNRYRVTGIGYKFIASNTSTTEHAQCCVIQKPVATAITNANTMFETPYAKCRVLSPEGSGTASVVFKGYMSAAKALGIKRIRYDTDDVYSAVMSANPAQTAYIHLYSIGSDHVTLTMVRWTCILTYYVTLFDRHTLTES